MILTPIDHMALAEGIRDFNAALKDHRLAGTALRRITALIPAGDLMSLSTDPAHHAQAVALCQSFSLATIDVDPHDHFTWDGGAVATRMEPSVVIHEAAHYQCAAPARRTLIDFGLGAGPETGRRAEADAQRVATDLEADIEEAFASLLGILWEAALGQPAVLAFLEQNWLEGGATPRNVAHFVKVMDRLAAIGLVDGDGRPTRALRMQDDAAFFAAWRTA